MTEAPIVNVEQGRLQGRVVASPSGKAFYSFQGIPYAKPPLGSLRFKAPQPAEPWEGVRDATSEGNVSAQINQLVSNEYTGDENCLFLNVYTPNLDGEFLPVMVFIHGGAYTFGSGSSSMYGGDYLVEKDVILVTINYRCGPLGFLSLNTPEVPGNAGLKDMVAALKWVTDNIHNFGGNSGNITVFGESCGGAAVTILTASPLSKNLINKAIVQSGTALNSWAFQKNPIDNAKNLAKTLGCESDDVDDILEFLNATSAKDIVEANSKIQTQELFVEGQILFGPVIEKEFSNVEAILTESFIDLLTSGRIAEIPIMIGSTSLEFALERHTDDLQSMIPHDLSVERNTEEAVAIAEKIKKLYFAGNHTGVESLTEYFQLLSDKLVNIDTHRYIQFLIQVTNKPIYYYKFDYVGELNLSGKLLTSLGLKHAGHMDELGYLFKNDLQKDVEPTAQDIKMRERMLRLWTNFAKSGNPTPDENHYLTVTWQPVTIDNLYYLNLGNELSLGTNPDKEKMELWDSLYTKYYKIWEHPRVNNEIAPRKEVVPEIEVNNVDDVAEVNEVAEVSDEVAEVSDEVAIAEASEVTEVETTVDDVEEKVEESVEETVQVQAEEVEEAPLSPTPSPEPEEPTPVQMNGNGIEKKPRPSNEIKMVHQTNGGPKDVIRANDPPEDDLPKNIGVNKFVNFFESLGGKK